MISNPFHFTFLSGIRRGNTQEEPDRSLEGPKGAPRPEGVVSLVKPVHHFCTARKRHWENDIVHFALRFSSFLSTVSVLEKGII